MNASTQRRHARGTPSGGRFAPGLRGEPPATETGDPWTVAGFTDHASLPWRRNGFTPHDAAAWRSVGITPQMASDWRGDGISPPPPRSEPDDDPDLHLASRDGHAWAAATRTGPIREAPDLPGDRLPDGRYVPEDDPR